MDREAEIDRLYSLPLGEFVAARNDLAKTLRAAGDRAGADEVKGLAKPNVPAWAVNRLWWGERDAFERLLAAGAVERAALADSRAGTRGATAERRQALKTLQTAARRLLVEAGHAEAPATRQRISRTLEAVAALGAEAIATPLGRFTRELEPPGFDVLAGLELSLAPAAAKTARRKTAPKASSRKRSGAAAPPSRRKVRPAASAAQERRLQAARKALEERQAELATAEREAAAAAARLREARREVAEAKAAAAEAERQARRATEASAAARAGEEAAQRAAKAARVAVRRAASKVGTARRRLNRLPG